MASSTESPPASSLENPGHVTAPEPGQMTPQDANRPVGELTVVKVDPQKHPKNKRKRTQYGTRVPDGALVWSSGARLSSLPSIVNNG